MARYLRCKLMVPVNPQAQLIISLNTQDEFRNFLADARYVKEAYKAYKWFWKEHEDGVEMYNQLLRDKKAVDENNSRLRQEKNEQKKSVLRMKGAFTYVERQVAKLQAKQHCEPTPQPPPNNQTMLPQATPPPATPSEPILVGESKKIVVVPDPPIFNGDRKEKKVLYNYWLLQIRNKMTANEKMMPTKILKWTYVQSWVSSNALT